MEENSAPKNVAIKVIGLVVGIIAAIAAAAVIFSYTLMPVVRYNMSEQLADQGDYTTAAMRLKGLDYKDSAEKLDEYASIVVKEYVGKGEIDKAIEFLQKAYDLRSDDDVQRANDILNAAQNEKE